MFDNINNAPLLETFKFLKDVSASYAELLDVCEKDIEKNAKSAESLLDAFKILQRSNNISLSYLALSNKKLKEDLINYLEDLADSEEFVDQPEAHALSQRAEDIKDFLAEDDDFHTQNIDNTQPTTRGHTGLSAPFLKFASGVSALGTLASFMAIAAIASFSALNILAVSGFAFATIVTFSMAKLADRSNHIKDKDDVAVSIKNILKAEELGLSEDKKHQKNDIPEDILKKFAAAGGDNSAISR